MSEAKNTGPFVAGCRDDLQDFISRATQVRPQLGALEPQFIQPVYLLVDEYPEDAIDADEKHARMARSARLAPILISQSTSSLKAQFQDKEKAQALLDLAACRWAHQNGSLETHEWMAKTTGHIVVTRNRHQKGRNWDYGAQGGRGRNEGQNFNEQVDYDCPPRAFTRLLRGGPENGARTEAIYWGSGGKFDWNQRRWLPVVFQQYFKPDRDEVRSRHKGEEVITMLRHTSRSFLIRHPKMDGSDCDRFFGEMLRLATRTWPKREPWKDECSTKSSCPRFNGSRTRFSG